MSPAEYTIAVEFDDAGGFCHGDVYGSRGGFTFQGDTVAELKEAFRESLADYLLFCAERGRPPDPVFAGANLDKVSNDVHRAILADAARLEASLLPAS